MPLLKIIAEYKAIDYAEEYVSKLYQKYQDLKKKQKLYEYFLT